MGLVASVIILTLLFTLLFSAGYERERDPWALLWFFMAIFLPLWAFAVWIPPLGPTYNGVPWLQLVFFGIVLLMFVAAVTPGAYTKRKRTNLLRTEETENETWSRGGTGFFWAFLVMLVFLIIAGYFRALSPDLAH